MNTSAVAQATPSAHAFTQEARDAIYHAIFSRRDVRGQFLPTPVPDEVLSRILTAAHHAPSVGFMQPWNFLVVRSQDTKRRVQGAFAKAHAEAADMFEGDKRSMYQKLKLEGIVESPVGICITCDRERTGPVVVGRTHMKTMDLYSSVCAVQNLWLAARAEGIGLGWVSFFDPDTLAQLLALPAGARPLGILCIGRVPAFYPRPMFEDAGWGKRLGVGQVLFENTWPDDAESTPTAY